MRNIRSLFKKSCLVLILYTFAFAISAQENKAINPASLPNQPIIQKSQVPTITNQEDITKNSQKSLDRSIGILNIVATLMGVLVGLIALIMLLAAAFGIFESRRWRKARKDIEKEVARIKEIRKRAEEDANMLRKTIDKVPLSLAEKPSVEIKDKIDDFSRRLELLELLGVSLKPEDYYNRGVDLYYKKKYELALKAFEKAIELKPDFAEAWDNKGITLDKLGYRDEALKALEKAIELKPNNATAWDNKGVTLNNLGRLEDALKAYDRAIELKPDYANAWHNKACAYSLKGDKGNALQNLSKAIELDAKYKEMAKKDEDFKTLWDDKDFKKITK